MIKSKDLASFTTVCKKNTLAIKHNPVYAIVDKFFNKHTAEVGAFIKHNDVKKMRSTSAYLIKIPEDTMFLNRFASSGYVLSARHLRVDETYQRNEHGLMPAHYTEVYVNAVENLKIVVHGYFNSVGKHTHTAIKQIDLSTTIEQHLEMSVGMHQDIAKNLSTAAVVLHKLLEHKNELYKAELTNAEALGEALGKLYGAVNTVVGLEAYRIKATEFCACIDKINALNEINIDIRGKFIISQLEKISRLICVNNPISGTVVEDALPVVHLTVATKTRRKKNRAKKVQSQQNDVKKITGEIEKHINTVDAIHMPNIDVYALHQLIYTMQDASIELLFCSSVQVRKISIVYEQLLASISKAKNLVKIKIVELMNSGNVVGLAKVVEYGRNYLDFATCYKFVEKLIDISVKNKADVARVKNLIEVCDLLYAKSDIFKNAASTVAHCLSNTNNGMCISILLKLYQNKNLPVFKKIIEYGAHINIGFYSIKDKTYIPLMTTLIFCSLNDGNCEYVDVLLANNVAMLSGRDLNKIYSLTLPTIDTFPASECTTHISSTYQQLSNILYEYTPLEILLRHDYAEINYELLEKIAAISNLQSLALSLSGLVNSPHISTQCMPSMLEHGIYFCETADEKEQFYGKSFSAHKTDKLLYLISTAKGNKVVNLGKSAALLCKTFQQKCAKLENRHQIDFCLLEISQDCAAIADDSNFVYYTIIQQTACLLLLSSKQELNLNDSLQALRFFNNIRYIWRTNRHSYGDAVASNRMMNFLNTSKFVGELCKSLDAVTVQQLTVENDIITKHKVAELLGNIAADAQCNDYAKLTSRIADPLYQWININSPVPGGEGKTVLHYACLGQSYPCAKLLILLGASIELKDNVGQTALDLPGLPENIKNTLVKLYHVYQGMLEESPEYVQIFAMQQHHKNEECLNSILQIIGEIEKKYAIQREAVSQTHLYRRSCIVRAQTIAIKLPDVLPNPRTLVDKEIKALLNLR